jgi:hypothetical protein
MATEIWDDIEESELADDGATFEHGFLGIRIGSLLVNFIEGKNLGAVVDSTLEYRFLQRPPGSTKTRQPYKQQTYLFCLKRVFRVVSIAIPKLLLTWRSKFCHLPTGRMTSKIRFGFTSKRA